MDDMGGAPGADQALGTTGGKVGPWNWHRIAIIKLVNLGKSNLQSPGSDMSQHPRSKERDEMVVGRGGEK